MGRFDQYRKDVFYEPRALWEVVTVDVDAQQNTFMPLSRQELTQPFWRNGSRHTVVITHLLYSGINYLLQENDDSVVIGAVSTYNNALSVINRTEVFLSAPGRVHFSGEDIIITDQPAEPTAEPTMRYTATPYASGLFGINRWDFDFPMWIPRKGRVKMDLSTWLHPNVGLGTALATDIRMMMGVYEEPLEGYAERIPGTARFNDRALMLPAFTTVAWPQGPAPFAADAFGGVAVGAPQGTANFWNHQFDSRDFDSQEADRGATHKRLSGFAVAIDQISYDERIQTSATTGIAGQPLTPISQRVACRMRTDNGGSKEWWWRPGAPLALVCPSIGPALVHKLEDPIVLGQGDGLDLELQIPLGSAIPSDVDGTPTYQIGVSALGYAMIEG